MITNVRDIDKTYRTRLLSELRIVPYIAGDATITDKRLQMAITLNENLKSLGLTLKPADLGKIAASDMDTLFDEVSECVGQAKAKPMYPNFPKQVMKMDEATFRMHQFLHYFSTYGVMFITGAEVDKGWLPDVKDSKKTKKDTTLLDATRIELVDVNKIYEEPLRRILSKRERMTGKEIDIVKIALANVSPETLSTLDIPFKENLPIVFKTIFDTQSYNSTALAQLQAICKHTGDALRCIDYVLCKNGYSLSTSQKKLLVKLLESYPASNFAGNLVLTMKKAKRSNLMLQYLDYNKYSRSPAHKKVADDFRDGKLKSWESRVHSLIDAKNDKTLAFVAERPGMLIRMTGWLIREGFDASNIEDALAGNAGKLSTQTLTNILTVFGNQIQ